MPASRRYSWLFCGVLLSLLALTGAGYVGAKRFFPSPVAVVHAAEPASTKSAAVHVETASPTKGGLVRRTSQPGSAHSFESADLYAKVSGFLKTLKVDIGSQVKTGDLLAEVDVPELVEDVEGATAAYQQSVAEVTQAEARVDSAVADHLAAKARVAQANADAERFDAEVAYAQKQFDRIKELSDLKGIEDRLVDEKQYQLQASQANRRAAASAVLSYEQQAVAADSRIKLAKADLLVAKAKSSVAESRVDRAKLMVLYTKVFSPYDGVVTARNYHIGSFVRSPEQGGQTPIVAVERTDLMRVKVRIPEREIPYIQPGDRVTIRFDALPGKQFTEPVARIAESEDPTTRTMLAEVDVPNPDRIIRDQMYGRVEIMLDEALHGVTIPSACLVGDSADGQGQVYVVENGRAKLRKVQIGRDTGAQVEVLSGLNTSDNVIVRPAGGLADGAEVATAAGAAPAPAVAHK
jgi:RND family efflux transporter MFP subunit